MRLARHASLIVFALLLGVSAIGSAQDSPAFTMEQAGAGRTDYRQHCVACHGQRLEGMHLSPSLVGERFDRMWRGKSADLLFFHLRRMPQEPAGKPGSLSDEQYAGILAYILLSNGFEAGEAALPSDSGALGKVIIPRGDASDFDPFAPVAGAAEKSANLQGLPDVSSAELQTPSENDWLQWGRTYDGQNYSPLTIINRDNVAGLQLAWRAPLREGMSMPTPLVHHGVMFIQTFPDALLAIDATNGAVLWRHEYKPKFGSSQKMGLALHGDKVLVPTSDLHVIALDAKTGALIWDHEIQPETDPSMRARYQIRGAPMVVGDKVIQGVTASFVPRGGFLIGIDVESGKEEWRFNTIARPGTPGGETWNDLPIDDRSGGSVWHQGTYDPELNLIFYGIAPTYDTGPLLNSVEKEGVTNDALYTNCTVALNPETGELVWHYQHMQNDQWDLDWVFERQIVTIPVNGEPRKVVMNVGKMAILEALDAKTGEYLFSVDMGVQNVITVIDPNTGAKTFDPDKMPDPDRPCVICPSAFGARSWPPTSYSPRTKFLYVPITEWCMAFGKEGIKLLSSGVGITTAPHPATADGMMGKLQAVDVVQRKLAWSHDVAPPITTSVLSTAGGLVFSGDLEPSLKAFDDETGELLWQSGLEDLPSSSVISYRVDDRQYVAVVVGITNLHSRDLARTYGEFLASKGEPAFNPPNGGAAIWVFAL